MQETVLDRPHAGAPRLSAVLKDYYELTKPRIQVLLLITTAGAMWIASKGHVEPVLLLVTLLGGTLAASSANVFNCLIDRDIDLLMERTRRRPIPAGRIQPLQATLFALALGAASFVVLALFANLFAALLAITGIGFYVVVYTLWLKRTTTQNIVIGGAAGAIPPLVGWAAVTGSLDWSAWMLFGIIFLWTPPHFWALAMMIREDYRKAGVPMLPVVVGDEKTARWIFWYTLALLPVTLALYPLGTMGWIYLVAASGLGAWFLAGAARLLRVPHERKEARALFKRSIFYLMLLFVAMGIDSILLR
ncbi:heme o synthase [Gloeobacter kilaueensis]|uniref:Protoheme IX farnesyltransferase n=1 Tax=Gloeobacter kilaueensis (strain ATCC BAA-2537 / CCAP 1431/1 / ULC 316 / JS1) TaxID=1183438 RepID=U5QQY9_GLOK1|nr:heme o synthase [Gloeobacter kilaueensis]AGY60130.1 protoheme IX farnesyltransferase [Gloeobacter kilaueensis JS1]